MKIPKLWHDGDGFWWALLVFVCAVPVAFAAAVVTDVDRTLASYRDRGQHELDHLTLSEDLALESAAWGVATPVLFGPDGVRGRCGPEAVALAPRRTDVSDPAQGPAPAAMRRCCEVPARRAARAAFSSVRRARVRALRGFSAARAARRTHVRSSTGDRPNGPEVWAFSGIPGAHGRALGGDVAIGAFREARDASAASPRRQCAPG